MESPCFPTFLVIGAMKAGTTSLHEYLSAHPQVYMSKKKELNFFLGRSEWERGINWYESQFIGGAGSVAIGETSPNYTAFPFQSGVPERIVEVLPHARLVYVLREPIDRMISHYVHRVRKGKERRPMQEAITEDSPYVARSRYALQAARYLEHFERTQMLFITSEDLRWKRNDTLGKVFRFIGVDPSLLPTEEMREHHVTVEQRERRPFLPVPTRVPGRRLVGHLLPRRYHPAALAAYKRLSTRPLKTRTLRVPDDLRSRMKEWIRDDVRDLRDRIDPEVGGWGLT